MRALEAFPPGHPSSPYLADGTRRPPPPSPRSLALPIPDEWKDSRERPPEASPPDQARGVAWNDSGDRPRQAIDSDQSHGEGGQGHVVAKRGPADNIFGRSYDFPNSDAPSQPEAEHHWYWTEVPRFTRMWADHLDKWPADRQPTTTVDRSRDSPESWRSDSNLRLNADVHIRTREAIYDVQRAERPMTEHVHDVEQENIHGGRLEGLDFRLKGEDRLKEKVAEVLKREPGRTPDEVVREIPDAIRYTFCLRAEDYTDGYRDIRQRIEAFGYEMIYSKNYWNDPEYKGINTRWMTSEGQRFEVQFHTPESYHAKQEVTHEAYERIRNQLTGRAERPALKSFQCEVSSWIPVPEGATDIPDHKKEGM